MAKKVKKATRSAGPRKYHVHKKLEEPVHNLVGYSVLLALALVVLLLVVRVGS